METIARLPVNDPNVPPGWTYNPSRHSERTPLTVLAGGGLCVALYLGSYQLRLIPGVWDPIFGTASSERILNSSISQYLPLPDALLGAIAYFLDILGSSIGGEDRWKTRPWIVVFFGFVAGPVGFTSMLLVIVQPVFFNAWCALCLTSAAVSLLIIGPAMDEVLATLQYLQRVKLAKGPLWKAFWGKV